MRGTGWILAAAIVAGCVGMSFGGEPCVGCGGGGGQGFGQPGIAALSGDACFSPNGFAGYAPICAEGCPDRPCCQNAWDGYCERKARIKAWGPQNGVGLPRVWCGPFIRRVECAPGSSCAAPSCSTPSAPKREPTSSAGPVRRVPAVSPTGAAESAPMPPSTPPVPNEAEYKKPGSLLVR